MRMTTEFLDQKTGNVDSGSISMILTKLLVEFMKQCKVFTIIAKLGCKNKSIDSLIKKRLLGIKKVEWIYRNSKAFVTLLVAGIVKCCLALELGYEKIMTT